LAALYEVASFVGSNRVVKAEATTHPVGDPTLLPEKEKALRRKYVERALEILKENVHPKTAFFA
jgi:betaine reductase